MKVLRLWGPFLLLAFAVAFLGVVAAVTGLPLFPAP